MREYIDLFLIFARLGAVTFGGGYAMLPLLTHEFVDKRHWVDDQELTDYYAIGQCTPGIIAVNVATFIGNKRKGWLGGVVATLGFVTCPIILLILIAACLTNFADLPVVKNAFAGIRVCVVILILNTIVRLWKKSIADTFALILFLLILALNLFTDVSLVLLVIGAGVVGILARPILLAKKGGKKE